MVIAEINKSNNFGPIQLLNPLLRPMSKVRKTISLSITFHTDKIQYQLTPNETT